MIAGPSGTATGEYNAPVAARDLITVDPEVLGGTPVFRGTRVPVKTLFDYIEANYYIAAEVIPRGVPTEDQGHG
jgi:hypothetical protein